MRKWMVEGTGVQENMAKCKSGMESPIINANSKVSDSYDQWFCCKYVLICNLECRLQCLRVVYKKCPYYFNKV